MGWIESRGLVEERDIDARRDRIDVGAKSDTG